MTWLGSFRLEAAAGRRGEGVGAGRAAPASRSTTAGFVNFYLNSARDESNAWQGGPTGNLHGPVGQYSTRRASTPAPGIDKARAGRQESNERRRYACM